MARESEIERYLRIKVKEAGGLCWKWVSPGQLGVPDRIVIMPGGFVAFVETKAPGETERPSQVNVQRKLRDRQCVVFSSVDSRERVDEVVQCLKLVSEEELRKCKEVMPK